MADREVRKTRKDKDGDITALCNDGAAWSPRASRDAIADIETGLHTYHVYYGSERTEVRVVQGPNRKHLQTDPDNTRSNNLDELPDC